MHQFVNRPDFDLAADENSDSIGRRAKRINVMGYHEDSEPEALLQTVHELVEQRGRYGIKTRCRLVEEEQFGIEGKRTREARTPRPKPKIDFTIDALDYKNVNLLKQFVTDQGRILPRKYTGLPAHYQRRMTTAIKRARQMLLMK